MKALPLFLLTLFVQIVFAGTYKVSSADEFKTIIPKLVAGDEVVVANGEYQNWSITIPSSGTAEKPIVVRAETKGKVIFSGEVIQAVFRLSGAFITLKDIIFNGCNLDKANGNTGMLIELKKSTGCVVSNCSFTGNTAKAQFMPLVIVSGNGSANKIENCTFDGNINNQDVQVKITKDNCPQLTIIEHNQFSNKQKVSWKNGNGGECVQIGQDPVLLGTSIAKTTVRENTFTRCNGEPEVISNKSSGNSYIRNIFRENDGELVIRGGHDCVVDGNIFEGGNGGIRVNGTGHTIINNKITTSKTAIRLMYGMAKGKEEIGFYIAASNCIIKNNEIAKAETGILVGDSKNADWTGKFDTTRYPSRVMQDVVPSENQISDNVFKGTKNTIVYQ